MINTSETNTNTAVLVHPPCTSDSVKPRPRQDPSLFALFHYPACTPNETNEGKTRVAGADYLGIAINK